MHEMTLDCHNLEEHPPLSYLSNPFPAINIRIFIGLNTDVSMYELGGFHLNLLLPMHCKGRSYNMRALPFDLEVEPQELHFE
jgi:hypothetical protein